MEKNSEKNSRSPTSGASGAGGESKPGKVEQGEHIEISLGFLKKHWPLLILIVILAFGFYLRYYHVDYPVVGYHNWKETHYLTEARNFARDGFFAYGFFAPALDYPGLGNNPSGVHSDTFPVISIIVALLFKITGPSLWVARMVGILFSMGTIIVMYLFVKRLFHREDIALWSAALSAIAPLYVFFSHNVQLDNPGVFFMLLCGYYYLVWRERLLGRHFVLMSLFFVLAGLTKYPFMIIAVPIVATLPWKEALQIRKHAKEYLISIGFAVLLLAWFLYGNYALAATSGGGTTASLELINIANIFSPAWWDVIWSYIADNYTIRGFYVSIAGMAAIAAFFISRLRKKSLTIGDKFSFFSLIGVLIFVIIMSDKMKGHSYHQFPIAPFIILFMAFAAVLAGNTIAKLTRQKASSWIVLALIFFYLLGPSLEAKDRQFDTQFIGLDAAGEYIREHSDPSERIIHSGHQDYGIFWHADRKGIDGGVPSVDDIKRAEKDVNTQWVFLYQWGLASLQDQATRDYLSANYHLAQAGLQNTPNGMNIVYLLLRKGGTFNPDGLNDLLANKPSQTKTYESTRGTTQIVAVDAE